MAKTNNSMTLGNELYKVCTEMAGYKTRWAIVEILVLPMPLLWNNDIQGRITTAPNRWIETTRIHTHKDPIRTHIQILTGLWLSVSWLTYILLAWIHILKCYKCFRLPFLVFCYTVSASDLSVTAITIKLLHKLYEVLELWRAHMLVEANRSERSSASTRALRSVMQ